MPHAFGLDVGTTSPLAARRCSYIRIIRILDKTIPMLQDEDLMPHAFGLDVEDHFVTVGGSTKCLAALSLAEDRLAAGPRGAGASAAAGCKQGQNKGRASSAAAGKQQSAGQQQSAAPQQGQPQQSAEQQQHNSSEDVSLGPAFRAALLARLRFRRSFHQVRSLPTLLSSLCRPPQSIRCMYHRRCVNDDSKRRYTDGSQLACDDKQQASSSSSSCPDTQNALA